MNNPIRNVRMDLCSCSEGITGDSDWITGKQSLLWSPGFRSNQKQFSTISTLNCGKNLQVRVICVSAVRTDEHSVTNCQWDRSHLKCTREIEVVHKLTNSKLVPPHFLSLCSSIISTYNVNSQYVPVWTGLWWIWKKKKQAAVWQKKKNRNRPSFSQILFHPLQLWKVFQSGRRTSLYLFHVTPQRSRVPSLLHLGTGWKTRYCSALSINNNKHESTTWGLWIHATTAAAIWDHTIIYHN